MNAYITMKSLFEVNPCKKQVSLIARLKFLVWCHFLVKKASHKKRIKQAFQLLSLLNQDGFRRQPAQFFAYLRKIDPFVFEELLLLSFKARGCKVVHNSTYTGDGGIDGTAILPDGSCWIIQAKRYSQHISLEHVKQLAVLVEQQKRQGGIFIHTGKTGAGIYRHLGKNILLISGSRLHQLVSCALG